jgi:hypothetical protein
MLLHIPYMEHLGMEHLGTQLKGRAGKPKMKQTCIKREGQGTAHEKGSHEQTRTVRASQEKKE